MKIIESKSLLFGTILYCIITANAHAQGGTTTVTQDQKFEQLLAEKRKINSSITINDRYKIQIFNGDSETSKKTLTDFRRDYKSLDGTIVFSTPTYKVWVGNFKSRIEAERNLSELKKKYPNALLIKPNK
ncbi:sporulation protein [Flavobacterium noncentrifugens]|uniref:Sporulation related domain-containing protein n=1 Tax=Flavobacterium noncentrifugens TaxID=1128970 RepID=A0A1G8RYT5_9FLAO|nr:SPOR domain-containing protein [Flavobacterium noncentrifugens]GEP49634.1 sporulation protein [Flavobacterium noncentrifugens]SDJ22072.1 Sporulation related domain-containing protein [Flavobacterium noncentrifugens]